VGVLRQLENYCILCHNNRAINRLSVVFCCLATGGGIKIKFKHLLFVALVITTPMELFATAQALSDVSAYEIDLILG